MLEVFLQTLGNGPTWAVISALTTALMTVSGLYNKLLWDRATKSEARAIALDERLHTMQEKHLQEALESLRALQEAITTLEQFGNGADRILDRLHVIEVHLNRIADRKPIKGGEE